jgi:hypothetical protein
MERQPDRRWSRHQSGDGCPDPPATRRRRGRGCAHTEAIAELRQNADFDGASEAKLIALACSQPPEGYARWTLQMLEGKVVELNIVARASDNTIGRTLKKTFSSRT